MRFPLQPRSHSRAARIRRGVRRDVLRKRADLSILRVAPLVLLGAVSLPYVFPLGSLGAALPLIAASIAWISWIALFGRAALRHQGAHRARRSFLAISEKAVVITAIFLGFALLARLRAGARLPRLRPFGIARLAAALRVPHRLLLPIRAAYRTQAAPTARQEGLHALGGSSSHGA